MSEEPREREIIEMRPIRYNHIYGRNTNEALWGVHVVYRTASRGISAKEFYEVDELGAYLAFQKHCEHLDRVLARKRRSKKQWPIS